MKKMIGFCFGVLLFCAAHAQDRGIEITKVLAARLLPTRSCSTSGLRVELQGVYVLDGLLWFSLQVRNGSVIDWRASPMRFSIRDRRTLRRRARQELSLPVLVKREVLLVRSDSTVSLCYGLTPRIPGKGQDLVLEYGERNGDRRLALRLAATAILHARKLD